MEFNNPFKYLILFKLIILKRKELRNKRDMNHKAKRGIPAPILYPSGGSPPICKMEYVRIFGWYIPPTPVISKELNQQNIINKDSNSEWNARHYIDVMTEIEQERGPEYKDDDPHSHKLYMVNDDTVKE